MWTIAGRTVLITGATRGIGLETAKALGARGARVVLVGRHEGRLAGAVASVRARNGTVAGAYLCDFSSLEAVRQLSADVRRDHPAVHVLVNNAGGVHKRRTLTVDGLEATFATNHLAHFLLTTSLRDVLAASAPARVITVASVGHYQGTLDFDDLGFERGYGIMRAYGRSKLANVLFANELARRLAGTGVTSNSVHPGGVATHIWAGAPGWAKPLIWMMKWRLLPAAEGADPVVQLAVRPDLEQVTGRYFDMHAEATPSALAGDAALAARLWETSEQLVKGSADRHGARGDVEA